MVNVLIIAELPSCQMEQRSRNKYNKALHGVALNT